MSFPVTRPSSGALPGTRIEQNLRLIGHTTLDGAPNVGEGMAMKITSEGRRLLYVANEAPPVAMSILDVTEPSRPELIAQFACEHDSVRGNSLAMSGDTLLLAKQVSEPGMTPAGFDIFDISEPTRPEKAGFFDASGPHSIGTHFVSTMDGQFAHISTGAADFEPNDPRDHQFYMIVDITDRAHPTEAGRWWLPGQRKGDEGTIERHEHIDFAFRVHHTLSYPERPDRAYLGYIDGGVVTLDISDKSNPQLVNRLDYHPPFPGFTHTVVPLFERDLLLVADEATTVSDGADWPKRYWIVDVREETNPVIISSFPVPEGFDELHREGGRIGAHNVHENDPEPGSARLVNTCVGTWFSAGLRVYDIRDPFTPKEIGAFLPETPDGQRACRISDVFVDDRSIVYAGDRVSGGLYILDYTGDQPLD
jgi:hypothetical protein